MITPEMLYAQYSNFQTISVEDNYLIGRIVAEVNWGRLNLHHPANHLPPKIKSRRVTHSISDSTNLGLNTDIFQHGEYFSFLLVFPLEN